MAPDYQAWGHRGNRFPKAPWTENHSTRPQTNGSALSPGGGGGVSSLRWEPAGRAKGRIRPESTSQAVLTGAGGGRSEAPWFKALARGGPAWGLCVAGSIRHACLTESLGRHQTGLHNHVPSSGLASQASRCTKKSQRPLSPFSGQPAGGGRPRALPRTGGSDEAGALSPLVPSCLCFSLCLL